MKPPQPLVSVITATYNRSNVLALTIQTVLWQSWKNWELVVVGDACTDDTEAVVHSFQDPRITFFNLPQNVGEQSGPNNEGFNRSVGKYVAYLNHDDLWWPDHLEKALSEIQTTGADMVFSLVDRIYKDGRKDLNGLFPSRNYKPGPLVPASSWLVKRSLIEEIGPWRYYKEISSIPSQDWLFRAWKARKKLRLVPHLTVVAIGTRGRPGCYANRKEDDQQYFFNRLRTETDFRERELTDLLFYQNEYLSSPSVKYLSSSVPVSRLVRALHMKLKRRLVRTLRVGRYKGAQVDELRTIRGLPPIKPI